MYGDMTFFLQQRSALSSRFNSLVGTMMLNAYLGHWTLTAYTDSGFRWMEGEQRGKNGLTVDFCRKVGARYLVRGLRNPLDFMQEQELAKVNRQLNADVETVFLLSSPEWEIVSSSLVRELWSHGADYSPYVSYKLPEYPTR